MIRVVLVVAVVVTLLGYTGLSGLGFLSNKKADDLAQYALIVILVGIALIAALLILGLGVNGCCTINSSLNNI